MITSAKYTEQGSIVAIIDGAEMTVPDDMGNRHRVMLAEWEADGNVITPYSEPALTPEEKRERMPRKSSVEFRAALRKIRTASVPEGIYADDIRAKIALISDRDLQEEALDYFERGSYFERSNPWVDILGGMFGLTPEDIDTLWTT